MGKFIEKESEKKLFSNQEAKNAIKEAIKRAVEITREQGLKVGDLVGHPNERLCYKVKALEGDVAIIYLPDGTEKRFPTSELFEVAIAEQEVEKEAVKNTVNKYAPHINN